MALYMTANDYRAFARIRDAHPLVKPGASGHADGWPEMEHFLFTFIKTCLAKVAASGMPSCPNVVRMAEDYAVHMPSPVGEAELLATHPIPCCLSVTLMPVGGVIHNAHEVTRIEFVKGL